MDLSGISVTGMYIVPVQRKKGFVKTRYRRNEGIILMEKGKIVYEVDGREYVQTPDVALILPAGIRYTIKHLEDSSSYVINFNEMTDIIKDEFVLVNLITKNYTYDKAKQLYKTNVLRSNSYLLRSMSILYSILEDINSSLTMSSQQIKYYEIIKDSVKYMEENYNKNIKNDDLAKISNISTVYFRKLFTKIYGMAPMKYMEVRKIEHAKELLILGELTISEIALVMGFRDVYHFSRNFKKITGFPPAGYRKTFSNKV